MDPCSTILVCPTTEEAREISKQSDHLHQQWIDQFSFKIDINTTVFRVNCQVQLVAQILGFFSWQLLQTVVSSGV
jgi:hypothetical protein